MGTYGPQTMADHRGAQSRRQALPTLTHAYESSMPGVGARRLRRSGGLCPHVKEAAPNLQVGARDGSLEAGGEGVMVGASRVGVRWLAAQASSTAVNSAWSSPKYRASSQPSDLAISASLAFWSGEAELGGRSSMAMNYLPRIVGRPSPREEAQEKRRAW